MAETVETEAGDPLALDAPDDTIIQHLQTLTVESVSARSRYMSNDQLDQNLRFYLGDQIDFVPPPELVVTIVNRVQNAVISIAATQSETQITPKLEPRETNDPITAFLKSEIGQALLEQIGVKAVAMQQQAGQPADVLDGLDLAALAELAGVPIPRNLTEPQLMGDDAIEADTYEDMLGMQRTAQQPDGTGGVAEMPVMDPETGEAATWFVKDDFYLVNDSTIADYEDTVLKFKWDEAELARFMQENILNSNVFGIQPLLVEYDAATFMFEPNNVQPKRVYLDPGASLKRRQSYIIFDEIRSEAEALARYPKKWHQTIKNEATAGQMTSLTGSSDDWGELDTLEYERKMVIVRHAWLRHQEYPADVDEALRFALVKEVLDQDTQQQGIITEDDGEDHPAYFIPSEDDENTGEPTYEGASNWPTILNGIRYLAVIGESKVEDVRCPYVDIPMSWNRCKPIPGKPWGIGMPEILEPIQRAINLLASTFVNHARYYDSPMEIISESMLRLMEDKDAAEVGSFPGRRVVVPDSLLLELGGNLVVYIDPPAIPGSLFSFFNFLIELFDDIGSQPDVTRGQSTPEATSGKAIEALQTAARGVFGYLAKQTEELAKDVVRVMLGVIRRQLPEHECMRCCSKYPIQVVRSIRARAATLQHDIKVELSGASGETKRAEQEQARLDYRAGLLSRETTLEKLGVPNVEAEMQRMVAEQQPVGPTQGLLAEAQGATAGPAPGWQGAGSAGITDQLTAPLR